jgi:hypothetical protein
VGVVEISGVTPGIESPTCDAGGVRLKVRKVCCGWGEIPLNEDLAALLPDVLSLSKINLWAWGLHDTFISHE